MNPYEIRFTKEAAKDVRKLTPNLKKKLSDILLNKIAIEPRSGKPLVGDLDGFFSIRLTYKDRIVYSIDEPKRIIFVHRARTHYGE
ncbi:MAG: type II toxin-antitoxin system mRNA interferase toxin, RelE/StbE family [Spartobacteria bacterium]|nr:type II toxin-antitoxin system mRNA interferase toxin, RelE/StbE family [Spartobacteria bacterium]